MSKKKRIEEMEEKVEEVSEKEQEIIDTYMDNKINKYIEEKEKKEAKLKKANDKVLENEIKNVDLDEYEIEDDFVEEKDKQQGHFFQKLLKVLFVLLILLLVFALIDIISITNYNKGPFFAIPIHTYDDGGTKEYYGLGYKVIKYHQVQGRRDTEVGTWALKYNVDPIYIDIIDLAIEFHNEEQVSYKKYMKQLLIVTGSLKEVDKKNNKIVLAYEDDGEKYSIHVVCNMETDKDSLDILEPKYEISAMGTMIDYKPKTKKKPATIYLTNCFAEQ